MKQRKIAYISETVLTDCDLPLLHELSKEVVVDYYIVVTNNSRQGTLIDLTLKEKGGIYSATEYPELKVLEKWMDLNHVFVVNKPVNHAVCHQLANVLVYQLFHAHNAQSLFVVSAYL